MRRVDKREAEFVGAIGLVVAKVPGDEHVQARRFQQQAAAAPGKHTYLAHDPSAISGPTATVELE